MHRRFIQLSLVLVIVLCGGTSAASTPIRCAEADCVYLPLVSTPQLVTATKVGLVGTRGGGTAVTGEVHVTTNTPVYSVTLEVRSYDSQGQLIDTTTGIPEFTATLPGQPNPFYFWIGVTEDQEFARYDVRVAKFSRTHPRTFLPVDVVITSSEYEAAYLKLAGTLTNKHSVPLEAIRGVVWSERQPYGPNAGVFASRLAPFETIPFSRQLYIGECGFGCDQIPYWIAAQGLVP